MGEIARLFKRCLIDGKYVGDEVTELRSQYQIVQYSFDQISDSGEAAGGGTGAKPAEAD